MNKEKDNLFNIIRLVGYPIGLGLVSVLVSGTLNRVMIVELALPATLVGLLFAIPLLISPLRVWLGYRSDAYPIGKLRREPYVILGVLFSGLSLIAVSYLALGKPLSLLVGLGLLLTISIHHLGKNIATNAFEALLTDKFAGHRKTQAMTGFKIAMFIGIMAGAIGLGKLLDTYTASKLMSVVIVTAIISFVLSMIAALKQEPLTPTQSKAADHAREVPFWQTIRKVVLGDPQVRRFFVCMTFIMVGTQAQDVILEPFGALVLGMSVGETSMLTAIWGSGTVIAMVFAGMWWIKKAGYRLVTKIGLFLNIFAFIGLVFSGLLNGLILFKVMVFVLGLGTGLASAGMLSAIVHFATPVRAGLLMSVWGLTHNLGQAIGSLLSGSIVDLLTKLSIGNALIAYGSVFTIESLLLLISLWLFGRIDVSESTAATEVEIPSAG